MCIIRLAALHPSMTLFVRAGYSSGVSSVPVAPPRRTWQSYSAADPGDVALMFHSIRMVPAVGLRVVMIRSYISTSPI